MYTLKRLLLSALILISLFTTAVAQEQKAGAWVGEGSTVTASARAGRVRLTAPPSVVQIRLEVYDESGRKLFDNDLRGGNVLDWHLQDGQAERLAEGRYLCVVTVKNLSGKLTQKIGAVKITDQQVVLEPVEASQLTAQQAEAVGPVEEGSSITLLKEGEPEATTVIAHDGKDGQIVSTSGALSFRLGDFYSGKDTEQMRLSEEGNLGIGVADPQAKLDVDGFIRATQGIVFPDGSIQFSASRKTYGPQSAGPGQFAKHPQSGREHFETAAAGTGTQNFIAKWTETGGAGTLGNSILFDNGTNVGIGTSSPAKKLDVRGGQIALDNSRFLYSRRYNGQFQEAFGIDSNDDIIFNRNSLVPGVDLDAPKASSALIFGTGAGKFLDIRNSANVVMLRVWEATGNVGIGNSNPTSRLDVAGNINTSTQYNIGGNRVLSVAGTNNLFAGVDAGINNTEGFRNSFFGYYAGVRNTTGHSNSFFGTLAGWFNTEGNLNSFFGATAGSDNTIGGSNSFFGQNAGGSNTEGFRNSFFGTVAGQYNTTGSNNSFFGDAAGLGNTTECCNTFLGTFSNGQAGITNSTAIGYNAKVAQSNSLVLGSINGENNATADTKVGIGTTAPTNRLHVRASFNSIATPANHVALIENTSTGTSPDVLALKIGRTTSPEGANNFITFFDGNDDSLGSIEGNGSGGVVLAGHGNDYAEWLPRIDPNEIIRPGEIVGVFDGKISKATRGASQVMVTSSSAIVAGNDPGTARRARHSLVAFIGQASVRVSGSVQAGDFIVASGQGDGIGKGVSPERITAEEFTQVVGQAWETRPGSGIREVRVAVGLTRNDPSVKRLVRQIQQQAAQIAEMEERLRAIEQVVEQKAGKSSNGRSGKVTSSRSGRK